jgi:FkbM family methyltransferase
VTVRLRTWSRSLLSPRERLLPGVGARLHRFPRLVAALLVTARRAPAGRARSNVYRGFSEPLLRRFNGTLEVPACGGSRIVVDPSDYVNRIIAITGVWEPQVTAAFQALLSPGDACVDVGANIGYFSLLAARLVGSRGHVYAVEPSSPSYDRLTKNLELNNATNVTALRFAAAADEGEATLYEGPRSNRGASSLYPSRSCHGSAISSVPLRRVESLISRDEVLRLRLVKIDVEGYEIEVLRGLEPLYLRGARPALVLEIFTEWLEVEGLAYLAEFSAKHRLATFRLDRGRLLDGCQGAPFAPSPTDIPSEEQEDWLFLPTP